MTRQIITATVGTANTLDPAVRGLTLQITAIVGIVRHFIVHVLPKSESLFVKADSGGEEMDSAHEVA